MPLLSFRGTAHPSAGAASDRRRPPDLSDAEIVADNLGSRGPKRRTTPVLVEHEGPRVGRVLTSFDHPRTGSMRVEGVVDDPVVAAQVRNGSLRGLSLSTHCQWRPTAGGQADTSGEPVTRVVDECSLVEVPGRPGCYIDVIDGKPVPTQRYSFSAKSGMS